MRVVNKITLKELCGTIKNHFLKLVNKETGEIPAGVRIPLARIVGKATGHFIKETDLGPSVGLRGSFTGMSLLPGDDYMKEVKGGQCYLPGSAGDLVAGAFGDEGAGRNSAVEFAFDIIGISDPTSNVLYKFEIESLQKPQTDDSLSRLLAALPPPPVPAGTTPPAAAPEAPPAGDAGKKPEPVSGPETGAEKTGADAAGNKDAGKPAGDKDTQKPADTAGKQSGAKPATPAAGGKPGQPAAHKRR